MATTTHLRSVHVDAPVDTVFDYVSSRRASPRRSAPTRPWAKCTSPPTASAARLGSWAGCLPVPHRVDPHASGVRRRRAHRRSRPPGEGDDHLRAGWQRNHAESGLGIGARRSAGGLDGRPGLLGRRSRPRRRTGQPAAGDRGLSEGPPTGAPGAGCGPRGISTAGRRVAPRRVRPRPRTSSRPIPRSRSVRESVLPAFGRDRVRSEISTSDLAWPSCWADPGPAGPRCPRPATGYRARSADSRAHSSSSASSPSTGSGTR